MIGILAKEYSRAVTAICALLDKESVQYDVYVTRNKKMLTERMIDSVSRRALFLIGDVWSWCETFADGFGLTIIYDRFAESKVAESCRTKNLSQPSRQVLDRICSLPESFIHFSSFGDFAGACGGMYRQCHVYILPNDATECEFVFCNYAKADLFKQNRQNAMCCFKLFGLTACDLNARLAKFESKSVALKCKTENLDSKVTLSFAPNCSEKVQNDVVANFAEQFSRYIYAESDVTLAAETVALLNKRNLTVAVAESITGGLIASKIVDVPGASNVLYEGAVTYSVESKCNRLGLNPHFIDEYGVVSAQVARKMALAQLENADFSISTTGYAGPTADDGLPVGLCYIGVGAKGGGKKQVMVFKNIFNGDRNTIRTAAADTALYLLIAALTKKNFFEINNLGEEQQ